MPDTLLALSRQGAAALDLLDHTAEWEDLTGIVEALTRDLILASGRARELVSDILFEALYLYAESIRFAATAAGLDTLSIEGCLNIAEAEYIEELKASRSLFPMPAVQPRLLKLAA